MRAFDWSRTPLGPADTWPTSLRTVVRVMLTSRYAMWMGWGPDLTFFYNDTYGRMTLGAKHPWALGRPSQQVWAEIWPHIGPRIDHVLQTGEATWDEALLLFLERNGYPEETYHTFSYSPIADDDGVIRGHLCVVTEETERVIGERRLATLRDVAAGIAATNTEHDLFAGLERSLDVGARDLPFTLTYVIDRDAGEARLAASTGVTRGHVFAVESFAIDDPGAPWPVKTALDAGSAVVDGLRARHHAPPTGPWERAADQALVVPIAQPGQSRAAGVFIAGVNPFRAIDQPYRSFVHLLAGQIAAGVSSARSYDEERRRVLALAELDRAKTAFFSNVSHEFRTPLTLMLGPTEDALASESRALTGENLDTVYRNELRLLKLVNALLDFSRLEAGRLRASYEPTDLSEVTADLASSFRSAFNRAGLQFIVACDRIGEPLFVDREMWEKVVFNLLSNALKFTFEGGVEVRLVDRGDDVALSVRDTGVGIPEADLPHVFDRFHRVEGTRSRTHEGSGIGLALVHELVRLHGGDSAVTSAPGVGTTITVTIPKGLAHLPADSVTTQRTSAAKSSNAHLAEALRWLTDEADDGPQVQETAPGSISDVPPGHIVLADDNADMREYLGRLLRRQWTVEAVSDGAEALVAIERRRPDLVLTDVMMPRVDGFQLMQSLRANPDTSAIPIIMLSARAGEEARVAGVQAGADDYLVKPFSARELLARVNAQLRVAQARRERDELLSREQDARREAELQKEHLYSLFMAAPLPIVVHRGPHHVMELVNPVACALLGRESEDLVGRPAFEAIPELRDHPFRELLDRVYASGLSQIGRDMPARLDRHGTGRLQLTYFDVVFTPLLNARGEVVGALSVGSDVTDQVIARREVNDLREAAESANRAKDEFLAMLGHELRNPLAPILTALQLLKLRGIEAGERERAIIERQVKHLVSLVDDLLDVSRITRGKIELRHEPIEAAEFVARAIEMASPLLEQQRHDLTVEVPRTGLMVDGDVDRLAQVVANLLTNAAKYTEPGGAIAVRGFAEHGEVVVTVKDTGIGIERDMLPRVFDLFVQQRQTLERSRGGLGLGLAIVRSLVGLHGGTVSATSDGAGAGSEFTIRLPHAAARRPSPEAAIDGAGQRAVGGQDGTRVLVVDDNIDGATLLAETLSAFGYQARAVHDGPTALAVADDFDPHVALLDIGLPVMDGFELARQFAARQRLRRTRLVALTGYGQEQDRAESAQAGFAAHLVKPVDALYLRQVIESVLERNAAS